MPQASRDATKTIDFIEPEAANQLRTENKGCIRKRLYVRLDVTLLES